MTQDIFMHTSMHDSFQGEMLRQIRAKGACTLMDAKERWNDAHALAEGSHRQG